MSQKPPRDIEAFRIEISETAQKIGLLQYQLEREIPSEIEKLLNKMHDLDREGKKMLKAQEEFEKHNPGHKVDLPTPESEHQVLSVVPDAST